MPHKCSGLNPVVEGATISGALTVLIANPSSEPGQAAPINRAFSGSETVQLMRVYHSSDRLQDSIAGLFEATRGHAGYGKLCEPQSKHQL
jgi:hypothetical protein